MSRRRFATRTVASIAVAVVAAALTGACTSTGGGDTLADAKSSKSIRIGIANEQPYGFTDASGRATGEATEVARAAFKAIGIDNVEAKVVPFDQLIPALNAGQFDVVAAGMFITPERCKQAEFSIPDYTAPTALLVPRGNPKGLRDLADVAAKKARLATLSGAVEKGYAEAAGVPADQITALDNQDNLLRAVTDGRVDAAALTGISLNWLVKQNPGVAVEVTPSFAPKDTSGAEVTSAAGFVFRQNDDELREAFDGELRKLQQSGQWLQIVGEFGFTQDNQPKPDQTTQQFCAA